MVSRPSGSDPWVSISDRLLDLVAVAPGIFHAENRFYCETPQASDAFERFLYELAFGAELGLIGQVLPCAASASKRGAWSVERNGGRRSTLNA